MTRSMRDAVLRSLTQWLAGDVWSANRQTARVAAFDPGGFEIDLGFAGGGRLEVAFGSWVHVVPPVPEPEAIEDALDLLAAGLFGFARIVEHRVGAVVFRTDVWFDGEPTAYARVNTGRMRWFARTERVPLRNAWPCPPGLQLGRGARLARAPWLGTIDRSHDAEAVHVPCDGELDLHTFAPRDVGALVREYVATCHFEGRLDLRIVHGKGTGALRRTVHAELSRNDRVQSFRLGGMGEGSWGATIVRLRPRSEG